MYKSIYNLLKGMRKCFFNLHYFNSVRRHPPKRLRKTVTKKIINIFYFNSLKLFVLLIYNLII